MDGHGTDLARGILLDALLEVLLAELKLKLDVLRRRSRRQLSLNPFKEYLTTTTTAATTTTTTTTTTTVSFSNSKDKPYQY
jgi:hypothetical protein